jgi:hypothetical protein
MKDKKKDLDTSPYIQNVRQTPTRGLGLFLGRQQLIKELSERPLYGLGECVIVAHGKVEETDKLITAKLRVEYEFTD